MYRLIYVSTSTEDSPHQHIEDILEEARSRNAKHEVTGLLVYQDGSYLQYIEGAKFDVRKIFSDIRMDARHKQVVQIMAVESVDDERLFKEWSMGFSIVDSTSFKDLENVENVIDLAESFDKEIVLNYFRSFSRGGVKTISPFG